MITLALDCLLWLAQSSYTFLQLDCQCQCPAALHANAIYQAEAALLLQALLCCHLFCPPIWGLWQDLHRQPQIVSITCYHPELISQP